MRSSLDVVMIAMAPVFQQTFLALYVPNYLEVLFKLVFHISLHQPSRYFSRSTLAFIISGYFLHQADMQQPTPIFETGITSMHVGLSHCFHIISIDNYGKSAVEWGSVSCPARIVVERKLRNLMWAGEIKFR